MCDLRQWRVLLTACAIAVGGCSYRDDVPDRQAGSGAADAGVDTSRPIDVIADRDAAVLLDAAPDSGSHDAPSPLADAGLVDAAIDSPPPPPDAAPPPPDAAPPPPDAAPDAPPPAPASATIVYPEGRRHSPIDSAIAARLQAIATSGNARVFAKVGDSISATTSFLNCFASTSVDLGTHGDIADTIAYFLAGNAAGASPFARSSLAAIAGATAQAILTGNPTPLARELTAITPRYAVILLGTNDVRYGRTFDALGSDIWTVVDNTIAAGAVPILSTIPPINGDATTDARIPTVNRLIRAIAQGRRVPLVDYHREMLPLPSRGISSDGIHPTVSPSGACRLTAAGLQYGYNTRNLITAEALARARAAVAGTPADPPAPVRAGTGHANDPFIASAPFVDLGDTRTGDALIASYPCNSRPQAGGEIVYRFDVASPTTIDAYVVDRGNVDVDVHIFQGSLSPQACRSGGDRQASAAVAAGTVYVVVDTASNPGEYLLVVAPR